jgi:hypothetical protein
MSLLTERPVSINQAHVAQKLDKLLQEFRAGKRQSSVSVDSLSMDDREVWRTIRKDLEDIGLTVAAFEANKAFIFQWIRNAVASGAFERESLDDSPAATPHVPSTSEKSGGNCIYLFANTPLNMNTS